MSYLLAIISKAVFEKMVPKTVAPGEVVSTDRYSSTVKALDVLAEGGALFLVTVRPPDEKLWLVAILESPKKRNDGWYSKANATPIADITAAISKLQFANGAGLKAKKGALGMSLQTPRTLTDADVQLLRSFVAGSKGKSAPEAYAEAVAATPAAGKAARYATSLQKEEGLLPLRFDNYRLRANWKSCTAEEKKLAKPYRDA
jgi:hypothetical protein